MITLKLCGRHMTGLTDALKRKGMRHLINVDPERAAKCAREWLARESVPPDLFDPLAIAYIEINKKFTQGMGLRYVHVNTGEVCPLCKINNRFESATLDDVWIDNITTLMMLTAEKFKLKESSR